MTAQLETALGLDDFNKATRQNPDQKWAALLSGDYDSSFLQQAFQKQNQVYVHGVPVTVKFSKSGGWQQLPYRIVEGDLLETLSFPGAWTPSRLPESHMPQCQACHTVASTHHYARLSATLFHLCDDQRISDRVCKGFAKADFESVLGGKTLHEVLYGVKLKLTDDTREKIIVNAQNCITRTPKNCVKEPVAIAKKSSVLEFVESNLSQRVQIVCRYTEKKKKSWNLLESV